MNENELFQTALGILPPWLVDRCSFAVEPGRLDIYLDFPRGSTFPCPVCATAAKAYDTEALTWRHLNFFQHQTYLHARTPRLECSRCGVHRAALPWARPDSGFTLLLEAFVMQLAKVTTDRAAARRGQNYVSLFVDLDERKVLFVTPGKDSTTVAAFAQDLQAHRGDPKAITEVSGDMSPAFVKGITGQLPNASIAFDKFHVVRVVNDAVGEVRRLERKDHPELSGSRHIRLKNPANLTANRKNELAAYDLTRCHLKTARAYHLNPA